MFSLASKSATFSKDLVFNFLRGIGCNFDSAACKLSAPVNGLCSGTNCTAAVANVIACRRKKKKCAFYMGM